jgi:hypothetical protein
VWTGLIWLRNGTVFRVLVNMVRNKQVPQKGLSFFFIFKGLSAYIKSFCTTVLVHSLVGQGIAY